MEPQKLTVGEYEVSAVVDEKYRVVVSVRFGGRTVAGPIKVSRKGNIKMARSFGEDGAITITQNIIG